MPASQTNFNKKKVNYIARKRLKHKQKMDGKPSDTISNKKARQIMLMNRKLKKNSEKKALKEAEKAEKMEVESDEE